MKYKAMRAKLNELDVNLEKSFGVDYDVVGAVGFGRGDKIKIYSKKDTGDILMMTDFIYPTILHDDLKIVGVELICEIPVEKSGLDIREVAEADKINVMIKNNILYNAVSLLDYAGIQVISAYVRGQNFYSIGHTGEAKFTEPMEKAGLVY